MKIGDKRFRFEEDCKWLASPSTSSSPIQIIYFWSMSCPSCHINMPHLHKLRDDYAAKGLSVLGVHRPMHEGDLDMERLRVVATELGISEPCALDNSHSIGDAMGVNVWPSYFLFDGEHRLRRHAVGNFGVRVIGAALERMLASDEELSTQVKHNSTE